MAEGTARRAPWGLASIAAAAVAAAVVAGCGRSDAAKTPAAPTPVPVVVVAATQRTVPIEVDAIGTVVPVASVAIKARVDGELTGVLFKEGDFVRRGQALFQIDPRPMQAALAEAEANLARDRALADRAGRQDRRFGELRDQGYISKDAYAQYRTNAETAAATVRAGEAAVHSARLAVDYTHIDSPIDGVAGRLLLQRGNLVKANDTDPLVVINQVAPIYVEFAVPERFLPEIRRRMAQARLPVAAAAEGDAAHPAHGTLAFVDNTVDPATGTIKLRASFPNADRALWPGEFVRVTLTLAEQPDAVVVPPEAVQAGPGGAYVFVVKPDLTAEQRPVVVERTVAAGAVIARGLAPGERVVVDGQSRVAPGGRVAVRPSGEAG